MPHQNDKVVTSSPIVLPASADGVRSYTYLAFSLALVIFAVAPLFYPGYIQTHTGFIALWNVADVRTNLGNWAWLPDIAIDFDPLRSDGLLPYYLAAILPFEPASAIKVVLGLSWLLGNIGLFLWLKRWLGQPGALVGALVYTYLPYQIATVYVRGSWGEALVWGLLPWAILAGETASQQGSESKGRFPLSYSFLSVLVWFLLGLSHLGLTGWGFIFVSLLLWLTYHRQAGWTVLANFLGATLAAIINLFLLTPSSAFSSSSSRFFDHFLYPFQLLSAYWGFGPSRPNWDDGLSFQLGLAALGLTILTLFLWRKSNNLQPGRLRSHLIFFSGAALILILLQFHLSEFMWQLPFLADTLAYPWQLLGLVGLCLAVLAGTALCLDEQLTRLPILASIIILVILSSYSYLSPQFIQLEPSLTKGPQALWQANQLALLTHNFSVEISGNTAGLARESTTIPLTTHGPLAAGEVLRLNVIWQPLQAFTEDWKIFVHLIDSSGQVLAQFDGLPLAGTYPTSRWTPGELIPDSYRLPLPPDAPPGPYQIYIGLYNEASGARLPVPGETEGKVVLNVE